jgi:ABC-type multidrug transport system permease subunit
MNYLYFTAILVGVLVIVVILFFGVKAQKNNLFLALSLFCLCYSLLALL